MEKHFVEIKTTADDASLLKKISEKLLESKLAACVQISGPVQSSYRWQGKIETKEEWVLVAKSVSYLCQSVSSAIVELHTYDEPEIVATRIDAIPDGYAIWLQENLVD